MLTLARLDRLLLALRRHPAAPRPRGRRHVERRPPGRRCPSAGTTACTVTSTAGAPSMVLAGGDVLRRTGRPGRRRSARGCGPRRRRAAVERSRRTAPPRRPPRPGCCGRTAPAPPGGSRGTTGTSTTMHQHEVDDRRAALGRAGAATAQLHAGRARRAACAVSCGPASAHSAPTSPAVITVISTQPGTSPRSSRRRGAVSASSSGSCRIELVHRFLFSA